MQTTHTAAPTATPPASRPEGADCLALLHAAEVTRWTECRRLAAEMTEDPS